MEILYCTNVTREGRSAISVVKAWRGPDYELYRAMAVETFLSLITGNFWIKVTRVESKIYSIENRRPEFLVSRDYRPLMPLSDNTLLLLAQGNLEARSC